MAPEPNRAIRLWPSVFLRIEERWIWIIINNTTEVNKPPLQRTWWIIMAYLVFDFQSYLCFYLGKGSRLSTYRTASGSCRANYIGLPQNSVNRPFSKLEGHREAIIKGQKQCWCEGKKNPLRKSSDLGKGHCRQGDKNTLHILPRTWRVIYESRNKEPGSKNKSTNSTFITKDKQTASGPVPSLFRGGYKIIIDSAYSFNSSNECTITSPRRRRDRQ